LKSLILSDSPYLPVFTKFFVPNQARYQAALLPELAMKERDRARYQQIAHPPLMKGSGTIIFHHTKFVVKCPAH